MEALESVIRGLAYVPLSPNTFWLPYLPLNTQFPSLHYKNVGGGGGCDSVFFG